MINFKEKLLSDDKLIGTWSIIPCQDVYEIISLAGFDFIVADMEHGPFNIESIHQFVSFLEGKSITPIVRVPKLDKSYILRILETGVQTIQVSHIETAEDASKFVNFSKYPPIGQRGLSPVSRAAKYDYSGEKNHVNIQNKILTLIVNIEGGRGLKNLAEIADIPEIDILFLGIYDISQSEGVPGDIYHPKVKTAVKRAAQLIQEHGKIAGCFAKTINDVNYFRSLGVRYITYQADAPIIRDAFSKIVLNLKRDV